jgi:hypothetical protein
VVFFGVMKERIMKESGGFDLNGKTIFACWHAKDRNLNDSVFYG